MKSQSAKAKGRALQKLVRDKILIMFPHLYGNDVVSTSMGCKGVDVKLSPAALEVFPFAIECKNKENISLWKDWKQCEANAIEEALPPLLVVKRNRQSPLVVLELDLFLKLWRNVGKEIEIL